MLKLIGKLLISCLLMSELSSVPENLKFQTEFLDVGFRNSRYPENVVVVGKDKIDELGLFVGDFKLVYTLTGGIDA